jgi:serine/threonine protein kinase
MSTVATNQQLKSEDFERVSKIEKDFTPLKKMDDPRFGHVTIIQVPGNQRKLMCMEKIFNSKKELEEEIIAVKRRVGISNPNLLNLVDYSTGNRGDFCATFYWIKYYFEFPDHDLQQEIRRRAKYNLIGLNSEELTHMLYQISDGGAFLNSHGLIHGDICPEIIEMDSPEKYRLVEKFGDLARPDLIHQTRLWSGTTTYPAPEIYSKIITGSHIAQKGVFNASTELMKGDVFSLGMTMLVAGTGQGVADIYNKKGPPIKIEVLDKLKTIFYNRFSSDNILLATTVLSMVELTPEARPNFDTILTQNPPYMEVKEFFDQQKALGQKRFDHMNASNTQSNSGFNGGVHSMYATNLNTGPDTYQQYVSSNPWETEWANPQVMGYNRPQQHHGNGPLGGHIQMPAQYVNQGAQGPAGTTVVQQGGVPTPVQVAQAGMMVSQPAFPAPGSPVTLSPVQTQAQPHAYGQQSNFGGRVSQTLTTGQNPYTLQSNGAQPSRVATNNEFSGPNTTTGYAGAQGQQAFGGQNAFPGVQTAGNAQFGNNGVVGRG